MTDLVIALPYPLKVLGASVVGLRRQRLRYGTETDELARAALERETWGTASWEKWCQDRLRSILERARNLEGYEGLRPQPESNRLHEWRILDKERVRSNPGAFALKPASRSKVVRTVTSGSTGTPLALWVSHRSLREWYALFEARWRRWNGVTRFDRWAIIGGQRIVPVDKKHPPFWVWNAGMRQLYISAYHIARWSAGPIIEAMKRAGVVYLWGYASAMTELAREVLFQGLKPPPLRVVISNAEPLLQEQRRILREAFRTRVVNTYGMAEMVAGASECEYGTMHLWPEAGIVEVLDDEGKPCPAGEVGRLICTGLINDAMPLVRYEVGDRGAVAPASKRCPCGRTLPILEQIEGRLDDVVITPDGRRIGRLDTVFKADFPIRRAQIVQEELDHLTVRVEPGDSFSREAKELIRRAVQVRVGSGVHVDVKEVDEIPLSANGKFRGVISHVARDAMKYRAAPGQGLGSAR